MMSFTARTATARSPAAQAGTAWTGATVVLWVRSYVRSDFIDLGSGAADLRTILSTGKESRVGVSQAGAIAVYRYSWRAPGTPQFHLLSPAPMLLIPYWVLGIITAAL